MTWLKPASLSPSAPADPLHRRAAAGTLGLDFELVEGLAAFEALGPEWRALFDADGGPQQVFQDFDWLLAWARVYSGSDLRLAIVTLRRDGRLVFVWPLVIRRILGVRLLTAMGDPACQYSDALVAPSIEAGVLDAAVHWLGRLPADVVVLRRVRDDAAIASALRRRFGPPVERQAAPFIDFAQTPDVEAFTLSFPGKVRASRRRRHRRLSERGDLRVTHHAPSAEAQDLVSLAFGFKRAWARRHRVVAPALSDPRFERFFRSAAAPGSPGPALRVSALHCGPEIAGIEIAIACKGRLFGHVLAPNPAFESLGAGSVLAEATIHGALREGFDSVDLLAPADPYKREWTGLSVATSDYVAPVTPVGRLYANLVLTHGRRLAKRVAHRWRERRAKPSGDTAQS